MIVKIKMKDTTTPVYFEDVLSHFLEGPTLALLFKNGAVRNFPLVHIFYYETEQPRERLKTPEELSDPNNDISHHESLKFTGYDRKEANKEGWDLFHSEGSEGGPYKIQAIDDLGILKEDSDAWKIVANGTNSYHKKALDFIKIHNPQEYLRVINSNE